MVTINTNNREWNISKMLNLLKKRGYKLDFRREATCIYCIELNEWIMPEDFSIDEYYYVQDIASPDADRMLYAISIPLERKGLLIDACNVYRDNISPAAVPCLNINSSISLKQATG